MATVDVTVGEGWEEGDEGVVVTWLFREGANVREGDVIVEVMQVKVEMELTAPASGKLSILKQSDDIISQSTVLATIETA